MCYDKELLFLYLAYKSTTCTASQMSFLSLEMQSLSVVYNKNREVAFHQNRDLLP